MKRAWILTAFGDIRGYRRWCRNPSTTYEIRRPIMRKFLKEVISFSKGCNCQAKHLGDGFIFIFELSYLKNKQHCFHRVLTSLRELTIRIQKFINSCPWPAPDGFRMRITGGWVDAHPIKSGLEYIGEAPNLARDLLYVDPQIGILIHSSVVKKLSQDQIKNLKISKFTCKKNTKRIESHERNELWMMPL